MGCARRHDVNTLSGAQHIQSCSTSRINLAPGHEGSVSSCSASAPNTHPWTKWGIPANWTSGTSSRTREEAGKSQWDSEKPVKHEMIQWHQSSCYTHIRHEVIRIRAYTYCIFIYHIYLLIYWSGTNSRSETINSPSGAVFSPSLVAVLAVHNSARKFPRLCDALRSFLSWIKRYLKHSWKNYSPRGTCIYFHIIYVQIWFNVYYFMYLGSFWQHLWELPAPPRIWSGHEHNLQGDDASGEVSPAFGRSRAVLG